MGQVTTLRGRPAWTVENPPDHIRRLVDWWVHERRMGQQQADFAAAAGVSLQSVRNWMVDPRVKQLLGLALEESNASAPRVQMVLDMLFKRATVDEDVKAARTYLEAVGKMMPRKTEVDVTIRDARDLSNEQLRAELKRAVALLEAREPVAEIEEAVVLEDSTDPA
jgi:hypothetical protein